MNIFLKLSTIKQAKKIQLQNWHYNIYYTNIIAMKDIINSEKAGKSKGCQKVLQIQPH